MSLSYASGVSTRPLLGENLERAAARFPRYVHVVDGFPMTVTGKIRKVEMREQAVGLLGLQDAENIQNA